MLHQLHAWMLAWIQLVDTAGYLGIFVLMAMESSIIPVPSEVVVPPAAFLAVQGRFEWWGVILAATAGSLFGSLVSYAVSRAVGRPIVYRYGKYLFLPPAKLDMAERFITTYADGGIFFARLLPVVRHLCSIPAGLARMSVQRFILWTTVGAALWCSVLEWFGQQIFAGRSPEEAKRILGDPEALRALAKEKLHYFVIGAAVLFIAYVFVRRMTKAPAAVPTTGA